MSGTSTKKCIPYNDLLLICLKVIKNSVAHLRYLKDTLFDFSFITVKHLLLMLHHSSGRCTGMSFQNSRNYKQKQYFTRSDIQEYEHCHQKIYLRCVHKRDIEEFEPLPVFPTRVMQSAVYFGKSHELGG